MNSAERFNKLLGVANGEAYDDEQQRRDYRRFLLGFRASHLVLARDEALALVDEATPRELEMTAKKLGQIFEMKWMTAAKGTYDSGGRKHVLDLSTVLPNLSFPSLRWLPMNGVFKVHAYRLRDLVAYLAMWLLATGAVAIGRCPAPRRGSWEETCGRLFVSSGLGRPRQVCSSECAERVKSKRKNQRMKEDRRELKRLMEAQRKARKKGRWEE